VAKEDKEKAAQEEGAEATTDKKESSIAPKPEGFVSPYKFASLLSERLGRNIRPQTIYSQARNKPKLSDGTEFPVEVNTDGHYMINVEAAFEWYDKRASERAASAQAKADKEAAAAEAESE
jgi:hypothetical protein